MPFPPPVLPINRTDSLDQNANHPADHNSVNQAVNDTVAKLGPDPAGGLANTTVKFQAVDTAITNLQTQTTSALNGMKNPSVINGADHRDGATGFAIATGSTVVTTNTNGDFSINFLTMFAAAPTVICGGDTGQPAVIFSVNYPATTPSSFSGRAVFSTTAAVVPSAALRVNWIAIGNK